MIFFLIYCILFIKFQFNIMSSFSPKKSPSPLPSAYKKSLNTSKSPPYQQPFNSSRNQAGNNLDGSRVLSKSISKQTKSSSNLKNIKFSADMDTVLQQVTNNKNKLNACLQIYQMILNSVQNLRCLQHNNALSLYCLNERKILCVNCIYGAHKHRSHKIVPLKDCMDYVREDNQKLNFIMQEEIKKMDNYGKMSEQNSQILEAEMQRVISQMEKQYTQKTDQLKQKYETSKRTLQQNFKRIIQKSNTCKKSIEDFRFNVWKAFTMYRDKKQKQDNEIMKQMLFVTIVEMTEFKNRLITKTELDSLSRKIKQGHKDFL